MVTYKIVVASTTSVHSTMRSNEKHSKEIDIGQMETRNSDKTNESSRIRKELEKTDEN